MDNLIPFLSPEVKFEFVSQGGELVKAATGPDGKKMLHGVASSTTKDLHGDTILLSALEDMERTAVGMTIYLNHSYELPQDVGGTVTKAVIKQQGVDDNGDPNYSLLFDIEVEDENPAALQTWRYIQKGRKLGLSIGAMIPKDGAKRQKDGSYVIEHVNLLETSLVGIPANPKSWVDYAASALRGMIEKGSTHQLGSPTITLDAGRYKIEGSLEGLELSAETEVTLVEPEVEYAFADAVDGKTLITRSTIGPADESGVSEGHVETLGAWDLTDPDELLVAQATVGEDVITKATVWVTTRDGDKITIGDPVETSDGTPLNSAEPTTTAEIDPEVEAAKVRIIEVDTDETSSDGGQGASSSEPDDEAVLSADPVILDDLTGDELLKLSFGQVQSAALAAVTQLSEVKRLLSEEKSARTEAERQRDAAITAAGELIRDTSAVIEKIANSPLARKAAIRDVEKQFSATVESYYGTEIARAMAGTTS